jgi:hypothetical protein
MPGPRFESGTMIGVRHGDESPTRLGWSWRTWLVLGVVFAAPFAVLMAVLTALS